jgi:hypothetical protein
MRKYDPDEPRDERGRWTDGAGRSIERSQVGEYPKLTAVDNGKVVGELWLKTNGQVADVRVKPEEQRKGIATALYDAAGVTTASDNLSRAGFNLWMARDPSQVANSLYHHYDALIGKTLPNGDKIVDVRNDFASAKGGGITYPVSRAELVHLGLISPMAKGTKMADLSDPQVIDRLKKLGIYDALRKQPDVADVHAGGVIGGDKKKPPTKDDDGDGDNTGGDADQDDATKSFGTDFEVCKVDADQRMIFGWASVSALDGVEIIDKQDDIIPVKEMEPAVYDFVLNVRKHGDMHDEVGTGQLVESMFFTPEKEKLGIVAKNEKGQVVHGWWTGFYVESDRVWKDIKAGKRPEFSIGGSAKRVNA